MNGSSLPVLNCDNCGVCCEHQGSLPFTVLHPELYAIHGWQMPDWGRESDEAKRWETIPPEALAVMREYHETDEKLDRYNRGLPCLWYDPQTKKCRFYEHRPDACREFEMGGSDCLRMRAERFGGLPLRRGLHSRDRQRNKRMANRRRR